MAGEIGALGELATGSLIAHAVDGPPAAHGPTQQDKCANCGWQVDGHFCGVCGQHAQVDRSVAHIAEELLHGLTHFDGKAWRTLPALFFRPGTLTRDYVYGKRARYIAPMALFLFTVFLMFFTFGWIGGPDINKALDAANSGHFEQLAEARSGIADINGEVVDTQNEIAAAERDPDTKPADLAALRQTLAAKRTALAAAEQVLVRVQALPDPATGKAAARQRWQDSLAEAVRDNKFKISAPTPAIAARVREALLNPDFALYRIQQKAYKLSFLLIPLSFPVLWLMFFWRRDVRSFDHLVFALYSLSFMSLLAISGVVLMHFGVGIGGTLLLIPPVHMFFQLKGAYRLGVGGALWRTAVLGLSSVVILSLFAALIVIVGLAD